jgi:hypothetical protein
MKINVTNVG